MWLLIKALQNSLEQEIFTYNQRVKETSDLMRDEEQQMNNKIDSLQQICEDESNRMFDEAEQEIQEIEDNQDRKRQELDSERLSEELAEADNITELRKGQDKSSNSTRSALRITETRPPKREGLRPAGPACSAEKREEHGRRTYCDHQTLLSLSYHSYR